MAVSVPHLVLDQALHELSEFELTVVLTWAGGRLSRPCPWASEVARGRLM